MEWSNEKILEFIDLYRTEPCLWSPKHKQYKSRTAQTEAWLRIKHSLSFQTECEELKKKKDSLLAYYRTHKRKYNKSMESEDNDIYVTKWFAFERIDSFLGPIYATNSKLNSESLDFLEENDGFEVTVETGEELGDPLDETDITTCSINLESEEKPANFSETRVGKKRAYSHYENKYTTPEIVTRIIKTEHDYNNLDLHTDKRDQYDEYDHFALMLASKIRKIKSEDDKEVLMNSIQNLVFQCYMKNKKKS